MTLRLIEGSEEPSMGDFERFALQMGDQGAKHVAGAAYVGDDYK